MQDSIKINLAYLRVQSTTWHFTIHGDTRVGDQTLWDIEFTRRGTQGTALAGAVGFTNVLRATGDATSIDFRDPVSSLWQESVVVTILV